MRKVDREGWGAVLAEVRAVYDELAQRPVERNCTGLTNCCRFRLTGLVPYLTKGEAILAAHSWRASGRRKLPNETPGGACPMLSCTTGRCLIYSERPFACRTHYCAAAGGPLQRRAVIDLIRRLERVDVQLGGGGARKLPGALAAALAELA